MLLVLTLARVDSQVLSSSVSSATWSRQKQDLTEPLRDWTFALDSRLEQEKSSIFNLKSPLLTQHCRCLDPDASSSRLLLVLVEGGRPRGGTLGKGNLGFGVRSPLAPRQATKSGRQSPEVAVGGSGPGQGEEESWTAAPKPGSFPLLTVLVVLRGRPRGTTAPRPPVCGGSRDYLLPDTTRCVKLRLHLTRSRHWAVCSSVRDLEVKKVCAGLLVQGVQGVGVWRGGLRKYRNTEQRAAAGRGPPAGPLRPSLTLAASGGAAASSFFPAFIMFI